MSIREILWSLVCKCDNYERFVRFVSMLVFRGCFHQYVIRSSSWYQETACHDMTHLSSTNTMVLMGALDPMSDGVMQRDFFKTHYPDVRFELKAKWSHGSLLLPHNILESVRLIETHLGS